MFVLMQLILECMFSFTFVITVRHNGNNLIKGHFTLSAKIKKKAEHANRCLGVIYIEIVTCNNLWLGFSSTLNIKKYKSTSC